MRLSDRLALIAIETNIDRVIEDSLKPILPKFKKSKLTKSKNLLKTRLLKQIF